jgi:GldM C-terminal domain
MAAKINVNRYRLITLLYIVFVCLSVLNVPTSLYQGNLYVIKTFDHQEGILKTLIAENSRILDGMDGSQRQKWENDQRLLISVAGEYKTLDSVDRVILNKLKKEETSVELDFNSRRRIESYLIEDHLLEVLRKIAFKKRGLKNDIVNALLPSVNEITLNTGKVMEWDQYLFLHKPLGVSYMQLKRFKVLLLEQQLAYQLDLLKNVGVEKQFVSTSDLGKRLIKKASQVTVNQETSTLKDVEPNPLQPIETKEKDNSKELSVAKVANDQFRDSTFIKREQLESIMSSLKVDKFYVGVQNTLMSGFNDKHFKNFQLVIGPTAQIVKTKDDIYASFRSPGIYLLRFYDNNGDKNDFVFEKKIKVYPLPEPTVSLNVANLSSGVITRKVLVSSTRLIATFPNSEFASFPGRINGYRFVKYNGDNTTESLYNYGDTFQSALQAILAKAKKGDIVVFDNITISLNGGSSRTATPLIYKIAD